MAWADAITKAKDLVSQLTLEEKVNLTSGVTSTTGCSGFIGGIPRVGFPGLCLNNAGNGVGATDYVSAFASGIHVAASWNKELAYDRAWHMGLEARTKGVNILLGPVVGPVGRVVQGGRNWEGKRWPPLHTEWAQLLSISPQASPPIHISVASWFMKPWLGPKTLES